jgi:molybdenum cofactor biosynthesis enzyme MoaA
MSSHFCGGCNRLRITADGHLKVCLFGDEALSLKDAMRQGMSDDEIVQLIATAVLGKKKSLGGHASPEEIAATGNRPMILIGG